MAPDQWKHLKSWKDISTIKSEDQFSQHQYQQQCLFPTHTPTLQLSIPNTHNKELTITAQRHFMNSISVQEKRKMPKWDCRTGQRKYKLTTTVAMIIFKTGGTAHWWNTCLASQGPGLMLNTPKDLRKPGLYFTDFGSPLLSLLPQCHMLLDKGDREKPCHQSTIKHLLFRASKDFSP